MDSQDTIPTPENPLFVRSLKEVDEALTRETLTQKEADRVKAWLHTVNEARVFLVKLLVEAEAVNLGTFHGAVSLMQWALLRDKGFEDTALIQGFFNWTEGEKRLCIPALWCESKQPPDLVVLLARVWGESDPRAQETLVTSMTGGTRNLRAAIALGQVLLPSEGAVAHEFSLTRTKDGDFPEDGKTMCERDVHNFSAISLAPQEYYMWGMPNELRNMVRTTLSAIHRGDPTRLSVFRNPAADGVDESKD